MDSAMYSESKKVEWLPASWMVWIEATSSVFEMALMKETLTYEVIIIQDDYQASLILV